LLFELGMDDAAQLRDRAARLFAIALAADKKGQSVISDELMQLASEALSHAEDIDRRSAPIRSESGAQGYDRWH
jgi:hypothetical protein